MSARTCCGGMRVAACAVVVGVLFASLIGLNAGQSSDGGGVRFGFSPMAALAAFAVGGIVGVIIGELWGRRGVVKLVGMVLVVAVGGLLGLAVAGLAGAESRTVVEGNAVGTEFGATRPVLLTGGAIGLGVGALTAWRFRPRPVG